jgi:cyclopropane fatty-acyl-phospholipid synthase-like methyltransferase
MTATQEMFDHRPRRPKRAVRLLLKVLHWRRLVDAKRYVGTDDVSGQLQLELLKRQGCVPASRVLEIGCGCLHLGIPLMQYLDKGHFAGIDPNEWLRVKVMKNRRLRRIVEEREARFLSGDDFDGSGFGVPFDFIFSHSVLSHCAHRQLELFLRNSVKVLAPGGRILSSIRLAEGNAYGSTGTPDKKDSMDDKWQYPGVSWFKLSTLVQTADRLGLTTTHIPEYTEFYTKTRPYEIHDWLVFHRKAAGS